jgi:hypothetical protein
MLASPMIRLVYKITTPSRPALLGLVRKIMLKKEVQARTLAKIRAIK